MINARKYLRFFFAILFFLTLTGLVGAQFFPPAKPRASQEPTSRIDEEVYNPAGIIFKDAFLKAGEKLEIVWGVMGPPDHVWAMRGKDNDSQDYVKIDYYSYGLSFDVENMNNTVKGIFVKENHNSLKLVNVPFSIGQDHQIVYDTWGEPEQSFPGTMAYWRRGVYIVVDESGLISHIYMTSPGVYEDEGKDEK